MSRGRFRRYVRRALEALPPHFRAAVDNVIVVIERSPRPTDYDSASDPSPHPPHLFGIYRGVPLHERTSDYHLAAPDVIALFHRPLTRYCRSRRRLRQEIRLTVLHEFGHYFGLDEQALEHV
ncbi:MAG: metallopeptidase family protein [Chloroflexi bacterium]|nr:metallopeptidase family protein [Chloroflexota bacterium]